MAITIKLRQPEEKVTMPVKKHKPGIVYHDLSWLLKDDYAIVEVSATRGDNTVTINPVKVRRKPKYPQLLFGAIRIAQDVAEKKLLKKDLVKFQQVI